MKIQRKKLFVVYSVSTICLVVLVLSLIVNATSRQQKTLAKAESGKTASDSAIVKVVVSEVTENPFEDWGSFSADLRGIDDVMLTAPYQGGRVNGIKPVGSRVQAGEELCDIDGDKYEAANEAAKAQVEVTRNEYERARVNVENGSIGRSAMDAANLAYQNAKLSLVNTRRALQDCHCEAPFEGILVSRNIDKYQTVAPGSQTVRISRLDRLEAVIAIPESEAFSFGEGMKTRFHLLQNPEREYEGNLTNIDRAVDTRSRTVTARITILNRDGLLKPGMVGRAEILRKSYVRAIVIPSTALVRMQNGIFGMVVENGVAQQRLLQVATISGDNALITQGLKKGDLLIVTGAFQVSNGTKVAY